MNQTLLWPVFMGHKWTKKWARMLDRLETAEYHWPSQLTTLGRKMKATFAKQKAILLQLSNWSGGSKATILKWSGILIQDS